MALEHGDSTQRGNETSLGCFETKGFFCGPHYYRNFTGPQMGLTKQGSGVSETDGSVNGDKPTHPSECFPRPTTQQQNYFWWSAFNPNFLKEVHYQSHPHEGCFYPRHYSPTNWVPHIPFQTHPLSHPPEHAFQDFQYFVVIDFEATCDKDKNPHPQEIIEFPSVLVNSRTGQLEDSFQIYVRPTYNQLLSDFCKELTGIQQSQVDKGVLLGDALLMHDKWLEEKGIKHTNFAVVTWSNWDCRVMLESECRFKRIRKPPYFNKWINLRVPFNEVFGGVRCNLKEAVELAGLTWEGRAHCGLDDAKNTARLLAHLMHHGFKFSITNSLLWQAPEYHPSAIHQAATPDHGLAYHPHKFKLPFLTVIPVQTGQQPEPMKEQYMYCHCGVISIKRMVKKPGPKHGSFFFGCGNWTAHRGALCPFFEWAVTDSAETA